MTPTTGARTPQALGETRRWAEPGSKSAALFAKAQGVMPGGNTRTTVYMAPYPPYAASGDGCWVTDVEGDRRLDCLNNYTALIHGHAHAAIVEAATRRLALGSSFPLPTRKRSSSPRCSASASPPPSACASPTRAARR